MKIKNFKLKIKGLSNIIFFITTTLVILSLNLTPLIAYIRHAPNGRTFAMIHNNVQDFFFYQSLMNEGANGAWLISDPYTTEPHQSSIIFAYFAWLGKISKLLGLSYTVTYHLVRIISGILLLLTSYFLILMLNLPYPRLAFLFFVFASPLMHTDASGNRIPYMNWWTGMDPIRRVAYLPHHMAGSLLLVLSIIFLIKFFKGHNKYLLSATLIAPILAFIHTPSLFILLLILPVAVILQIALRQAWRGDGKATKTPPRWRGNDLDSSDGGGISIASPGVKKSVIGLFIYWLTGLLFLFLMLYQTKSGFPWSQYIAWEKKLQFPLDKELIGALGILFPLSLIGIFNALRSKRFDYILIACWFIVPLLFIPFAQKLNISNIRLIQGTPYLPLTILAVFGIKALIDYLNSKINKFIGLLGYWVIGLLFIIFTYPTLSWSLKDQIREYWPIFGNVYLDNRLLKTFSYINQNFPPKTVTLSTFYTGNYLPAFTNTISFIGHFGYTYNMEEKQQSVSTFFQNKMPEKQAKEFIKNNKIALIFQGPEEKPIYNKYLYPDLLKVVYDREEVTIYTPKL